MRHNFKVRDVCVYAEIAVANQRARLGLERAHGRVLQCIDCPYGSMRAFERMV